MFCSKCGAKAIDGAVFCQKCGAKLILDNREEQEPEEVPVPLAEMPSETEQKSVDETESMPESEGSGTDIYALLKENIGMCPAIKSAKQFKKGVRLRGRIYSHSVRLVTVHAVQARIRSSLAFPFSILYGLPAVLFCFIAGIVLAELVKYGSIYREYHHNILIALCCLLTGAIVLVHAFGGRKEKDAVKTYVHELLEPKQIYLSERKWTVAPMIKAVTAVALIVAGIIVIQLNLPNLKESIEYPDELLFDGLPAVRFLDMTQKDLEAEFGEPVSTYQNMTTGDDCYDYSCGGYDTISHVIYSKETGKVIYVQFDAIQCSCNGKKLNKPSKRVLDILSERYVGGYYSFGVYGSIHNGFYYDGVYFGETTDLEEYMVRKEFEDSWARIHYCIPLQPYGEIYYNSQFSANVRDLQDYNIDLIIEIVKYNDKLNGVYDVCLYTDEWVQTVNATAVSPGQTYTNETGSSDTGEVLYKGIPISSLFGNSAAQVAEMLGWPSGQDRDDDIRLYISDSGDVEQVEIWNPGALTLGGETLEKSRDELAEFFGEPDEEGYSGGGYGMRCLFGAYSLYFELGEPDDLAWRVTIYPVPQEASDDYGSQAWSAGMEGASGIYGETDRDGLYYGEIPLIDLLYKSGEEVCNVLGFPPSGTPVNGELLYGGTEYYAYDGLALFFDNQTDTVAIISVQSDMVKINGETLDKDRTELINLLGRPSYEGYYYDEAGEGDDYYYMQYTLYGIGVNFDIQLPDLYGYAEAVTIYEYDDGPGDEWD